jgi:hypothetical protein
MHDVATTRTRFREVLEVLAILAMVRYCMAPMACAQLHHCILILFHPMRVCQQQVGIIHGPPVAECFQSHVQHLAEFGPPAWKGERVRIN